MINNEFEQHIIDNILYTKKFSIQINCCRIKESWLNNHIPGAYEYLKSRFEDTKNIPEVLYRIYHKIDSPPVCEVCHNSLCHFIDFNNGYSKTCSKNCTLHMEIKENADNVSDDEIIKHFYNQNGTLISTYATKRHCQLYGYYHYLYNRYDDINEKTSISEILYRIKNKIQIIPKCPVCGRPVNFKRHDEGYRKYCSLSCSRKSEEYYRNRKNTRDISKIKKWKDLGFDIELDPNNDDIYVINNKCDIHKSFNIKSSTFYNRWDTDIVLCPICNPERNLETSIEQIIKNILDNNNINYVQHNRTIIKPKELDFYLPNYKIGIECNGIYWHSGEYGKKLSLEKYQLSIDNGIQILTFWEDDIHNKKDIVESIIKTKCMLNKKIFARKCKVREIDSNVAKEFINKNHLQGNINASIRLGLFLDDELLQVMTFGKLRKCLGASAKNNTYELYRLCTKQGISVIGGASKLFEHFKNNYIFDTVISYCHNEISNGAVYVKLGFEFDKECGQGYSYFNSKISKNRINRYSLRKSVVNDNSGNTADEILKKQGYLKCYNAGVRKYVYHQN